MSKALALVSDRHHLLNSFHDGLVYTFEAALEKDNGYTLFRAEDWKAWAIFSAVFLTLIVFDNVVLHRNPKALTVTSAVLYTVFWMLMAGAFCGWVAWWYNPSSAYMWASGYMLEWMLSFDNLFVFHMIFSVYACPDNLKHRPLYLGIMGAVVFRLAFIFIGEYLMHTMWFMHFIFGAFLVYTGVGTVTGDEEDDNPREQPLVMWLEKHIAFHPIYAKDGSFFVNMPVNDKGEVVINDDAIVKQEASEETPLVQDEENGSQASSEIPRVDVVDFSLVQATGRTERRATMLFLVVCCLEISDILFAVDSVSAIVAQVNDLFLAYTSAVFAMLGLRATFFIIDVLVKLFELLKYGVAIVLVFIGVKLIVSKFYHIPASIVCVVLVGAIGGSMVASVIKEKLEEKAKGIESPTVKDRIAEVLKKSPCPSPAPGSKVPAKA